jgi:diguanylate cyclase (GGDEF)-like protein/putative nucleotidyltransferase with HDIG domain
MERRITQIRWLGIGLCAVIMPFLGLNVQYLPFYALLTMAAAYNVLFGRLVAVGRPSWLLKVYAYGAFDIVVATAIIVATGGPDSPFVPAYFLIVAHGAIRFGRQVAILSSGLTALCYVSVVMISRGDATEHLAISLLQMGFLGLTGIFAGVLSDRARAAEQALARQLEQTRALNQAGSVLNGTLDWHALMSKIVEQGRAMAEADVAILELESARQRSNTQEPPGARERSTEALPQAAYLAKLVLQSGALEYLPNPRSGQVEIRDLVEAVDLFGDHCRKFLPASLMRAPIFLQQRWIGDLILLRTTGRSPFTEGDADMMSAFINQASLTLENARHYLHARELAATDPITGLPNHRALKERLDTEIERARQCDGTVSALMLDLDHFKDFNDAFGHAAGDEALREIAGILRSCLRPRDFAARYAGEEFVVLLPATTPDDGMTAANRILEAVAGLAGNTETSLPSPVTVSIGVAAFPEHGGDRDQLLQAADLAMYVAKHLGRNRACSAGNLDSRQSMKAIVGKMIDWIEVSTMRPGPHLVADLEQRLARLESTDTDSPGFGFDGDGERTQDYTIQTVTALATTLDAKDHYTDGHSRNVSVLCAALASHIGLDEETVETIRIAGLLHDIGKIGISESILQKPGDLTAEEQEIMRAHPEIGARILSPIAALVAVTPLVRHHHERWDGQGYPERLAGEAIPLGARIIAICEAYESMVSDRPYRRNLGHAGAARQLTAGAGTQFDPKLVEAFLSRPVAPTRVNAVGEHMAGTDPRWRRDRTSVSSAKHQPRSLNVR